MKKLISDQMPATIVPVRSVLGLGEPEGDAGALRQLQLTPLRGKNFPRLLVNSVGVLLGAASMLDSLPWPVIAIWLASGLILALWSHELFRIVSRGDIDGSGLREYRMCNLHALLTASIWAAAFWLHGVAPPVEHILSLWAITLMLMLTVSVLAYSVPMACILFLAPVNLAAAAAMATTKEPYHAFIFIAVGVLLSILCIRSAQIHVRFRRFEDVLSKREEAVTILMREFEEPSADWLWQTDRNRRLIHVSPRLAYALGTTTEALDGMALVQALAGDSWEIGVFPESLHLLADRMHSRASFSNLILPVPFNGKPRWLDLSAAPHMDEAGQFCGYRGIGSDVTEKYASAEQIAKMARYDNLTGLANRVSLNEDLERALAHAAAARALCAILMIDLDRFKTVNDTLGHAIGDKLLQQVAARLRGLMTKGMTCGRTGGDEFGVVLHDIRTIAEPQDLAQRIIATINRPDIVDEHQLFVGASIGIAIGPQDGSTVETLTRNADLALHKSKDDGGNVAAAYIASLHTRAEERRVMEQELRGALDRDEFSLHFQPVVTAMDGKLNGFEALIRWHNGRLGAVSPGQFIPLAEDSRLIAPIGEWVLRTACREAMRWPSHLKVAINVSAEQLTDPGFAAVVASALTDSGMPPHRLEIEITESVFLRDGGGAAQLLEQLITMGVRLSLDDFGTGYSSLGYLRKAQFSTIKVDRSFVVGAAKGATESIAIIRAVVVLADSLGMATTAEGAETEREVDTLRSLGCSNIQGYYFGRPMPANDVFTLFPSPKAAAR